MLNSMKILVKRELEFRHVWKREYCDVSNIN